MNNEEHLSGDILVVDDTPANLRLLSGMLIEQGYKVRSAPNGKLALMGARAIPPDLILLDINMPGMNGYEVCAELKADSQTSDVPIIFISALDQTEDKVKAFTLGGVDYITKPFRLEEVLARVQTHLTLHNLKRQLETANADLRTANTDLEASNADLNAFAHTVAHDLKTPLSSVIGFSSLLESRFTRMDADKILENLHRITQTGYKMRDIIDGLLLLASVRQMTEIELTPLDMGDIVAAGLERLDMKIQAAQAEIVLPETWPEATGYAPWIEEVWANYISNAIKYGGDPDAGIVPHVELGWEDEGEKQEAGGKQQDTGSKIQDAIKYPASGIRHPASCCRFFVRDNGPGLTPEQQTQLFESFTRLHQQRAGGHGFGLSIVRRIVEKLGGNVGVESVGAVGQGSTFWFSLPK